MNDRHSDLQMEAAVLAAVRQRGLREQGRNEGSPRTLLTVHLSRSAPATPPNETRLAELTRMLVERQRESCLESWVAEDLLSDCRATDGSD